MIFLLEVGVQNNTELYLLREIFADRVGDGRMMVQDDGVLGW